MDHLFWPVDWILGTGSPQDPCDSTKFRTGLLRVLWVFPKQRFPSHYKSCWGGKLHRSQSPQWSYSWWATSVYEDQECKGLWILVLSLALKFFLRLLLKQICNKKNLSASKIQICEVIKLSKIKVEKRVDTDTMLWNAQSFMNKFCFFQLRYDDLKKSHLSRD